MSANKIDMSLDQIIKQNRQEKRQNRQGGSSQRGRRGRGAGARGGGRGRPRGGIKTGRGGRFGNAGGGEAGFRQTAGARAAQQRRLAAMRSALNIRRRGPALVQQQRQPRQVIGLARLKQRLALTLIKRARLSREQQRRIGVVVTPNAALGGVRQRRAARRQALGFAGRQLQLSGLARGAASQRRGRGRGRPIGGMRSNMSSQMRNRLGWQRRKQEQRQRVGGRQLQMGGMRSDQMTVGGGARRRNFQGIASPRMQGRLGGSGGRRGAGFGRGGGNRFQQTRNFGGRQRKGRGDFRATEALFGNNRGGGGRGGGGRRRQVFF